MPSLSPCLSRIACFFQVALVLTIGLGLAAADWPRFRGPNGSGVSTDKANLPTEWSETKNLAWKIELPGPGLSSPIVVGSKVFVTSWSGYGVDRGDPGEQENLRRHLLCIERESGKTIWSKTIEPVLPEDRYRGMFAENGYASHTPVSDGERVYAFFGKTGVLAYDLDGKELWRKSVGTGSGMRGWGTASSPIVHDKLLIVPATSESEAIIAFDKMTGEEVWRQEAEGFAGTWGTPVLSEVDGRTLVVLAVPFEIWAINPQNGKLRWYCDGIDSDSMCASVVEQDGVLYAVGGREGSSVAVRGGGKSNVNESHVIWRARNRGRIGTPLVHDGRLYWVNSKVVNCVDAKTGKRVFQGRLSGAGGASPSGARRGRGRGGQDYGSPIIADGKMYYFARSGDAWVVGLGGEFQQLAHNRFEQGGEFSATPAVSDGQLFVRSTKYLYCIAEEGSKAGDRDK